jgi:hypothetical protein
MLPEDSEACSPLLLNEKEEHILAVVRDMTYVTALDIKHLVFPERSLTTVQRVLATLASGKNNILDRFPMPSTTTGMKQLVYVLSTRGREVLGVDGYYRPYQVRARSYSHIQHHLCLTRFVCSALVMVKTHPQVRLADVRLCYELAKELGKGEHANDDAPTPVADGWLHFELVDAETGDHKTYIPVWLEIDRGSMYRKRLQQHVEDRIEFIRSEKYADFFQEDAVRIAYVVVGNRSEPLHSRRSAICTWTKELLTDLKLKEWSHVFYITHLVYEDIYTLKHFSDPVWYTPFDSKPRSLLDQKLSETHLPTSGRGACS